MTHDFLIAFIEQAITPTSLLISANGALTVALSKIYTDCRRDHKECRVDRDKLWVHIKNLERRLG